MDNDRGVIRNREYATQVRDFSGLRFGTITPTDIDGLIEYKNSSYALIETKYMSAELPYGQRLALERLCDDLQKIKPTIAIIASHNSEGDIDVANTTVTEIRWDNRWIKQNSETLTREMLDRFFTWVEHKPTWTESERK